MTQHQGTGGLWKWAEAVVNVVDDHFELRYATPESSDETILVARVGRPTATTFPVQFMIDGTSPRGASAIRTVRNELDFYLMEKGESNPWGYAQFHCRASANLYSSVHWSFHSQNQKPGASQLLSLTFSAMSFQPAELDAWKNKGTWVNEGPLWPRWSGNYTYLKRILASKAMKRAERRPNSSWFFGEAYVATNVEHIEGYYVPFEWLTNRRFAGVGAFREGSARRYQEELKTALSKHFPTQLTALQQDAARLQGVIGEKPMPPDLWLIDHDGNHRFIEVKLPGDTVNSHQFAGLALIATCLTAKTKVSVEIIDLHPDGVSGMSSEDDEYFSMCCKHLKKRT